MLFALKYYIRVIKMYFSAFGKTFLITAACVGFIIGIFCFDYRNPSPEKYFTPFIPVLVFIGLWLVFMIILSLYEFSVGYKVEKIHNEKGFCLEYFYAFEKAYIRNKPKNSTNLIIFAEIYQKLGDCSSALDILDSINIYELTVTQRAAHIFVYMMTAVKMKNTALTDEIWRRNEQFIADNINKPYMGGYTYLLYYAMTLADASAGRYQRAFDTCERILKIEGNKNKGDFYVLKIYLLKKLEREECVNDAVGEFNEFAKTWKPVYQSTRATLQEEAEKAIRGELPV